jgi:hypothetical protein
VTPVRKELRKHRLEHFFTLDRISWLRRIVDDPDQTAHRWRGESYHFIDPVWIINGCWGIKNCPNVTNPIARTLFYCADLMRGTV